MKYLEIGTVVEVPYSKGTYMKITGVPAPRDGEPTCLDYPYISCTRTGKEFKTKSGISVKWLHEGLSKWPSHYKILGVFEVGSEKCKERK